jgi:hypothetical protein
MSSIDQIIPRDAHERLIGVSLADPNARLVAGVPISFALDFDRFVERGGVVLPLLVTFGAPTPKGIRFQLLERFAPSFLAYTPRARGRHVVSIREIYGHHHWGSLSFDVG